MSRQRQPGWLSRARRERLHAIGTRLLDGLAGEETHEPTLEEGVDKAQRQLHGLSEELLDAHARISELDSELSHLKTEAGQPVVPAAPAAPAQPAAPAEPAAPTPPLTDAATAQVGEVLSLLEEQVAGMEQRVASFDAALAATREHASALERRIAESHGEAARLREEVDALHQEAERRERELEGTTTELESALVELAETRSGMGADRGLPFS